MNHPSSEHQLLGELKSLLTIHSDNYEVEIGDDAAVRKGNNSDQIILTTDLCVENVHFKTSWMTFQEIGYKAMVTNLSDCASMGALPESALIQLVFPKNDPSLKQHITQIYQGFNDACTRWHFPIIGGDLSSGNSWIIGITLLGTVPVSSRTLKRIGAKNGDNLWVSGLTGKSRAGLECLQKWGREKTPSHYSELINAHIKPFPQVDLGKELRENSHVHAMMDLSDGLAKDARTLAFENDLGIILEFSSSHISPLMIELGKISDTNPLDWVIQGGEEYELLFAASEDFNPDTICCETGKKCFCIGKFTNKNKGLWFKGDTEICEISANGWNHI